MTKEEYKAIHKAFKKKLMEVFDQNVTPGWGQMYQIAKRLECSKQAVDNWMKGRTTPSAKFLSRIIEMFDVNQSDKELLLKLRKEKTLGKPRYPENIIKTTKKSYAILLEALKENAVELESGRQDVDRTILQLIKKIEILKEQNMTNEIQI